MDVTDFTIFKHIVRSLMCLSGPRPDLTFAVCLISRYMEKQTEKHLIATKRILGYLKEILDYGSMYKSGLEDELMRKIFM
jgi:hypothetical protein